MPAAAAPGDLKSLFAERVVLAPGSTTWLQVRLRGRGLGDGQMVALGRFLDALLEKHSPASGGEVCASVELAENAIGSAGLTAVLDALEKYRVSCKCLKLYKNKIGDDGGVRLARMVANQASAIEELHLSHNVLTQRTLVAICMAMGKHEGYPQLGRSRLYIPCWLRMEYNHISRPLEVVEVLRRDGEVPICTADIRDDCGPWRCSRAGRSPRGVPKVHLFTISVQSRSHRPATTDEAELREEIRRWGGRSGPPAPSVRMAPAGARPPGPPGATPTSPTPAGGCCGGCVGGRPPGPKAGPAAPSPANRGWGTPLGGSTTSSAWGGTSASLGSLNGGICPPVSGASLHEAEEQAAQHTGGPRGFGSAWDGPGTGERHVGGGYPTAAADGVGLATSVPKAAEAMVARRTDEGGRGDIREGTAEEAVPPPPPPPLPAAVGTAGAGTAKPAGVAGEQAASGGSPPAAGNHAQVHSAAAGGARCSLLLDVSGKRRIHPEQLEGSDGSTNQFVCPLCSFVMVKPVMTSCCHLFCSDCFTSYVGDQVSKQKSKAVASVPLLPCAQPGCTQQLRRQDITSLEKERDAKAGAAVLLQRLRNSLRVRCVHHTDLFSCHFGKDASAVARTRRVTCSWVGDLGGYDDHLRKSCTVELAIVSAAGGQNGEDATPTSAAAAINGSAADERHQQQASEAAAAKASLAADTTAAAGGGGGGAATTAATRMDTAIAEGGEVRVARYDYLPQETDRAQIALKANDLVKVFEVTESGWAAGVRLSKRTKEEVGEAGWFPAAYLSPADHVAAEAA